MSKYDELVERLNARIEKQRSEHGNYFYNGVVDPELAKAAAAIITLEAELAEAQQQVKGALIMHDALSEKLENTQAELAAMKARGDRLAEALTNINRKASPDPERTMSEASNDLYWCACEARQALTEWRDQ